MKTLSLFCMLAIALFLVLVGIPGKAQVTTDTTVKVTVAKLPAASRDAQTPAAPATQTVATPAPALTTVTSSNLSIIGVVNGKGQASSGALLRVFTFTQIPKLSAYTFTGVGIGQKNTPVWVAPALGYAVTPTFMIEAGWQGLDVTTGQIAHGWGNFFAGISWSIPIRK